MFSRYTSLHRLVFVVALLILAGLVPIAAAQESELPDVIMAQHPGLHPEGIEWDAAGERFLLSSVTEGTVYSLADDGTVTPLIEDEDLVGSIGLQIDPDTNRLFVANSELSVWFVPDVMGQAMLGIYDLETGERLHMVDLGSLTGEGKHFANDVAVDDEGNAYVTDTFAGVIYRVDPEGNASVFADNEALGNPQGGVNGIEYHPDGYLLTAVAGAGAIYKIPIDDPDGLTQVALEMPVSGDGIILDENGDLIVIGSVPGEDGQPASTAVRLSSDDDWASATIEARQPLDMQMSTAAIRDGAVYAVAPHFDAVGAETPLEAFEITQLDLSGGMA